MLVFLSDLHLTDGSSGQTIKPGAFRVFGENLKRLAQSVKPLREIRLVLLGDVFDVVRSCQWLNATCRPWTSPGPELDKCISSITKRIIEKNAQSLEYLLGTKAIASELGVPFAITYLAGNHDRAIVHCSPAKQQVNQALGLAGDCPVEAEFFDPNYRVFACHGDKYDPFNYNGSEDPSSLGDAIVIELLDRYPEEVNLALERLVANGTVTSDLRKDIVDKLKELDNLRPATEAPSWVVKILSEVPNPEARKVIEETWRRCVDDFFKVDYVRAQDKRFHLDYVDLLRVALQLSSHVPKKTLERLLDWKSHVALADPDAHYLSMAGQEPRLRSGEASYVVYGHTHSAKTIPLEQVRFADGSVRGKLYFNTGTWRMTWNRTIAGRDFLGWHVLTYLAIFHPDENREYNFEVWNAALG